MNKTLIWTAAGIAAIGLGVPAYAAQASKSQPNTGTVTTTVEDVQGNCDEAEHANDPSCATVAVPAPQATPATQPGADDSTSTSVEHATEVNDLNDDANDDNGVDATENSIDDNGVDATDDSVNDANDDNGVDATVNSVHDANDDNGTDVAGTTVTSVDDNSTAAGGADDSGHHAGGDDTGHGGNDG